MRQLILAVLVGYALTTFAAGDDGKDGDLEDLVVPRPVMKFIMDCRKSRRDEELIPVLRTDIDADGSSTSQQVSLLGIDELHASLKSAIESDDVTHHIINRIRQEFSPVGPSFRTEHCPPTHNYLNISVPPQELKAYHLHLERALQQNNNNLVDLINDVMTSKMAALERSLENLIRSRTDQLNENIVKLSSALPLSDSNQEIVLSGLKDEPSKSEDVDSEPSNVEESANVDSEPSNVEETPQVVKNTHEASEDEAAPSNILAEIVEAIKVGYEEEQRNKSSTTETVPVTSSILQKEDVSSADGSTIQDGSQAEEDLSPLTELLQGSKFSFTKRKRDNPV